MTLVWRVYRSSASFSNLSPALHCLTFYCWLICFYTGADSVSDSSNSSDSVVQIHFASVSESKSNKNLAHVDAASTMMIALELGAWVASSQSLQEKALH